MSALDITHFVENLERGGLERVVIELIRAQRERGHHCRVICLFQHGKLAPELQAQGIDVQAVGKQAGFDLGAVGRARRLLLRHPRTVLHTHNGMSNYYAGLASWRLPLLRRVNTYHSMPPERASGRAEWLYRTSLRHTDVLAAVSELARRRFVEQGVTTRGQLVTVPNGIQLERFAPADRERHAWLAAELGAPPDALLLGTVGRLHPAKDQANLIRAFTTVGHAQPRARLVLVGDGALRLELEQLAAAGGMAGRIHFLGDRDDVAGLLRGLDLFVLSSRTEGYSMALLEACASALPIVATDVGGNSEIVREGINGRLVRAEDSAALAQGIIDVLAVPERLPEMGRAGREWVMGRGSFRAMADAYDGLYRPA